MGGSVVNVLILQKKIAVGSKIYLGVISEGKIQAFTYIK